MKSRARKLPANGLDLDDEIEFQHRSWRFQRWGRLGVLLFVIAAAVGFFGGGLIGDQVARDPTNQLEVTHPRFARHDSAYDIRITIDRALVRDNRVAFRIDHSLLENLIVEGLLPEPDSVEQRDDGVVFNFKSDASGALRIDGYFRTRGYGASRGKLDVVGGPTVELRHFIYP